MLCENILASSHNFKGLFDERLVLKVEFKLGSGSKSGSWSWLGLLGVGVMSWVMCFVGKKTTHKDKNMLLSVCLCVTSNRIYTDDVHVKYYSFVSHLVTGCLFLSSVALHVIASGI